MSGSVESIRQQPEANAGRHRRGATGGWTPTVPAQQTRAGGGRRHRQSETPVDPPVHGSLPVFERPLPSPLVSAKAPPFPAARGDLPVLRTPLPTPSAPPLSPAPPVATECAASGEPTARRTTVKLTPRPVRLVEEDDEDVLVYLAPQDGLGTFDLGSVPASVTPPKTWRKAAWFAALSSSGVVVALLFAGSLLVGAPEQNQASISWPGYRGGQTPRDQQETGTTSSQEAGLAGSPSDRTGTPSPVNDSQHLPGGASPDSAMGESGAPVGAPGTPGGGTGITTTVPGDATTTIPPKPPVTPAPMQSAPARLRVPSQNDAQTMGEHSQDFLNKVPEDPEAAAAYTTGELHDQGPQELAEPYSDVAYFVVKNVYIDPDEGYTINTVETTHRDGSKSTERRKLTFGDDNKIENDGR